MLFDNTNSGGNSPKREKLPELTAKQQSILEWIIHERIFDRMFFSGSNLELKEHFNSRKAKRTVSLKDVLLCLLECKYAGNLERGKKRNEVTFRVVGKDSAGDSLCVVLAINVTSKICYKSWKIKIVTVFANNNNQIT